MLAWAPGTGAVGSGAHPFNLEINGIDWIDRVQFASIRIEMPGPGSNGSMTFTLEDKDATVTVAEWYEVRFLEHAATRPILFGGFVQNVRYRTWARTGRSIEITCVGYGILLDKKVVPAITIDAAGAAADRTVDAACSVAGIYGGLIASTETPLLSVVRTDAEHSMSLVSNWEIFPLGGSLATAAATLRNWLENIAALSSYVDLSSVTQAAMGMIWVDSYRHLRMYPEAVTQWDDYRWDDAIPGPQVDMTGTYTVVSLGYEREDSDRATSAYVAGGSAPGTGYFRLDGLSRTGDLETLVSDSTSTTAATIAARGRAATGQTATATARGEVVIRSTTPLDMWTGRNIQVTAPQVGLAGEDWRITACVIAFQSTTSRTYTIGFGGNIPPPSVFRRQGRYTGRARGS